MRDDRTVTAGERTSWAAQIAGGSVSKLSRSAKLRVSPVKCADAVHVSPLDHKSNPLESHDQRWESELISGWVRDVRKQHRRKFSAF